MVMEDNTVKNDYRLKMKEVIDAGADELQSIYDRIKAEMTWETIWSELAAMGDMMDSVIEKTKKRFRELYHNLRDITKDREEIKKLDVFYQKLSDIVYDARLSADKSIESIRMKEHHSLEEYKKLELGKELRKTLVWAKEEIKKAFEDCFDR